MKAQESRYRLRIGEKVVGYMRKVSDNSLFYSTGGWWRGQKIEYDEVDEWTGLKDKNGRHIYEWDILKYKIDPDAKAYKKGVILWQAKNEEFGILDLEVRTFIPLSVQQLKMFNERQLQVYSYLFLNPKLKKKLDID